MPQVPFVNATARRIARRAWLKIRDSPYGPSFPQSLSFELKNPGGQRARQQNRPEWCRMDTDPLCSKARPFRMGSHQKQEPAPAGRWSKEVDMALITLTHTIGCNAEKIARRVADGLDVEVYDDARLKAEALRMGLHADQLKSFDEKPPDWFERLWSDKPEMHVRLMQSVVYEAARLGQGVIIGHGSQVLLHDFSCAMHVLVTSQEENRILNLMRQMELPREAAERLIHTGDKQKKGFFRHAFQRDWNDPALYDLCVNPDKIGAERAAQIIIEMSGFPELKACSSYALAALERLSKTKRIEASLMEMDIRHAGLTVEMPEKGIVHISGVLYNHEDKGRIPAVVGGIPGVEKVQLDVTLVPVGHD
jgi:cytidylate kinase